MSNFYESEEYIIPYSKVSHFFESQKSIQIYFTDGENMTISNAATATKISREIEAYWIEEKCYSNASVFFRYKLVSSMRLNTSIPTDFVLEIKMENYKQPITVEREASMDKIMEEYRNFLGK
jgi:hypothetical protein